MTSTAAIPAGKAVPGTPGLEVPGLSKKASRQIPMLPADADWALTPEQHSDIG
jgi:hypothetical protein